MKMCILFDVGRDWSHDVPKESAEENGLVKMTCRRSSPSSSLVGRCHAQLSSLDLEFGRSLLMSTAVGIRGRSAELWVV